MITVVIIIKISHVILFWYYLFLSYRSIRVVITLPVTTVALMTAIFLSVFKENIQFNEKHALATIQQRPSV